MSKVAETVQRHVVKAGDHWNVMKPEGKRPSASVNAQQEAIDRAKEIVRRAGGGSVIIHKRDGAVRTVLNVKPAE